VKHHCHWPGCTVEVPPKLWGCKKHWYSLPAELRAAIWREYRPGQEIDKRPSQAYLDVADAVEKWIRGGGGGGPVRQLELGGAR
jgi:hypothetical protein